jgi:hypothetical protein
MTDEPETQAEPDEDCQVAVQPLEGQEAASGNAAPASGVGFDPNVPVARSAPPSENLSGVPDLTTGENADVSPQAEAGGADEEPDDIE